MKEVKKYKCDICHTEYADKKLCIDCEKAHLKIKEIASARYNPITMGINPYPKTVDIQFADGTVKTYHR